MYIIMSKYKLNQMNESFFFIVFYVFSVNDGVTTLQAPFAIAIVTVISDRIDESHRKGKSTLF